MPKILHISPHMGGGVGKFLSQTTTYEKRNDSIYYHKIVLLEKPQKTQFIEICNKSGVQVEVAENFNCIEKEMAASDIVILHWWHHPAMCRLLANFPDIKIRLVIWAHVSGCNYPALTEELAMIPNKMFFTSPYSYENPLWSEEGRKIIKRKSEVIYGLGVENVIETENKKNHTNNEFIITYVGTLSKSKINPNFIEYCNQVINKIPCAKFVILGDLDENNALIEEARLRGIGKHFNFVGYTKEVDKYLYESDTFGYPLNPFHFGTTENSVMEAMAAGLPVVMLEQCTEKYIVENNYDGLLAKNGEEYAKCMQFLFENPKERIRIGQNAQKTVSEKFSMKKNVVKMHEQFELILNEEAQTFNFKDVIGGMPIQWFLSCLGENKELFENVLADKDNIELLKMINECEPILRGKSKGSAVHFSKVYPEDKDLDFLNKLFLEDERGE